jgi:geranylgeranyl pyrophosphate synthase
MTETYQPKNTSFEFYIQIGYEYASGKKLENKALKILEKISDIDTSIIKIDDILDGEEYRNGKKCIHLIDGIEKTIINAKLDEINGVQALTELIEFRKCFPLFSYEILKVFNNDYMRGIYEGQLIDKKLEESDVINEKTLSDYFLMIKKFTGGHIKYGLAIGQLLAGKIPDEKILKIGELIGVNRQILDDFNDYFKAHHNPFGDLKRGAKRLPEILFILSGGDRNLVLPEVEKKNFSRVIEIVLNNETRTQMYKVCKENIQKCIDLNSDFNINLINIDFEDILSKEL